MSSIQEKTDAPAEADRSKLTPFISRQEIADTVQRLAQEIDRDYAHRSPLLIGVLKGSFIFLADLVRQMDVAVRSIEFIRYASYDSGTVTSGRPRMALGLPRSTVEGQDVVLVEDIVDTGITTDAALRYLRRRKPASLALCALLDKPDRRRIPVPIDYTGIAIPDRFVVGYGLDADQRYRQLPAIYTLEE